MGVKAKMYSNKYKKKGGNSKKPSHEKNKKLETYVIEDAELLSKEQLKKVAKNPKNSIRPSGKRKRKMLKRLRHSEKEKNSMQVETLDAEPSTSAEKPGTSHTDSDQSDDSDMETS